MDYSFFILWRIYFQLIGCISFLQFDGLWRPGSYKSRRGDWRCRRGSTKRKVEAGGIIFSPLSFHYADASFCFVTSVFLVVQSYVGYWYFSWLLYFLRWRKCMRFWSQMWLMTEKVVDKNCYLLLVHVLLTCTYSVYNEYSLSVKDLKQYS